LWLFDDVGGWWLAASLAGLAKKVAAEMFEIEGNMNPASLKVFHCWRTECIKVMGSYLLG